MAPTTNAPGPYRASHANFLYQLLFCDDPSLFAPQAGSAVEPGSWQQILYGLAQPDPRAVEALATDRGAESRVRILACNWLNQHGHASLRPRDKELLGVIIEVSMKEGLDALAVYADARIRYLNHGGGIVIFEAAPQPVAGQAAQVLAAAQPVVTKIGPWNRPRLPHPQAGLLRLTFLVTDGLYFGQGPFAAMEQDPVARQLIAEFTKMQQLVVEAAPEGGGQNQPNGQVP
jgi:hypothetical protein